MDRNSQRDVAVKVVPDKFRELVQREISALHHVRRAGVSRVAHLLDTLLGDDGETYLVLEWVLGRESETCHSRISSRALTAIFVIAGWFQGFIWSSTRFGDATNISI